jgi:hypothetical protein
MAETPYMWLFSTLIIIFHAKCACLKASSAIYIWLRSGYSPLWRVIKAWLAVGYRWWVKRWSVGLHFSFHCLKFVFIWFIRQFSSDSDKGHTINKHCILFQFAFLEKLLLRFNMFFLKLTIGSTSLIFKDIIFEVWRRLNLTCKIYCCRKNWRRKKKYIYTPTKYNVKLFRYILISIKFTFELH